MKLYTNPLSPNCRKVNAVAEHLGVKIDMEIVELTLAKSSGLPASVFVANPNGLIPALVDGERTLWESNVIVAYVAGREDPKLWPRSDVRYDILKWMFWESNHFAPAVNRIIDEVIFAPAHGGKPDEAAIAKGLGEFRKYAGIADAQLKATKFLIGPDVTIADFIVSVWLSFERVCQLPIHEFPNVLRWWKDVQALPGGSALSIRR